jgi:hypothetical protein
MLLAKLMTWVVGNSCQKRHTSTIQVEFESGMNLSSYGDLKPEVKCFSFFVFCFTFHVTGIFLSNRKVLWKGLRFISSPFEPH